MKSEGLIPTAAPSASGFGKRTAREGLYPLWEMQTLHQLGEPHPERAAHWRWDALQPLIGDAITETSTRHSERRVLLLGNPAYPDVATQPHATPTFHGALQILMPGESARSHRHTPNALRFILEDGDETYTLVDGKECPMHRGDVIFTPANCWHGHYHKGTARSVWFDALDSQLGAYFDAGFFQPPSAELANPPATVAEACFVEPGLSPVLPDTVPTHYSPRLRFSWKSIQAALDAAPALDGGVRQIRFTNPTATGGLAMPHFDCQMVRLTGRDTRARRTTASTICVVAAGAGVSSFGDQIVSWSERDIFTAPHWAWATHRATSSTATLFTISDCALLSRLGLLREELGPMV
jgi:gentisate 1,2-dioxygenase